MCSFSSIAILAHMGIVEWHWGTILNVWWASSFYGRIVAALSLELEAGLGTVTLICQLLGNIDDASWGCCDDAIIVKFRTDAVAGEDAIGRFWPSCFYITRNFNCLLQQSCWSLMQWTSEPSKQLGTDKADVLVISKPHYFPIALFLGFGQPLTLHTQLTMVYSELDLSVVLFSLWECLTAEQSSCLVWQGFGQC